METSWERISSEDDTELLWLHMSYFQVSSSVFKNMFRYILYVGEHVCAVGIGRIHMDHSDPNICTVKRPSVQSMCAGPKSLHIYYEPDFEN